MTGVKGEALALAYLLSFGKALDEISDTAGLLEASLEYSHLIFQTQQTAVFLRRETDGVLHLEACSGWCPVDLGDRFEPTPDPEALTISPMNHNGSLWQRAILHVTDAVIVFDFSGDRRIDQASLRIFAGRFGRARSELRWLKSAVASHDAFIGPPRLAADLAGALAAEMGCGARQIAEFRVAAQLKDIGYQELAARFWDKPGPLTDEEWQENKKHPVLSETILDRQAAPVSIRMAVRQHHEHFNGKGYPDGLSTDAISLGGRILAVADAYTAMVSPRPHRRAMSGVQAIETISQSAGTQFDPRVVRLLALAVIRSKCINV